MTETMNENILEVTDILITAGIVLALFLALWAIWQFILCRLLTHLAQRTKQQWVKELVAAFRQPIGIYLLVLGVISALYTVPAVRTYVTAAQYGSVRRLLALFCITAGLIKARDLVELMLSSDKMPGTTTKTLTRFFTRVYCAVVAVFAVLMGLSELGYNVSGILTGLGLGSLTFALAAQDIAGNLFGGLVIILERPFEIGDWISTDAIEGTVEDITFRCTKVRTLSDALTVVPNNKLSGSAITNWTRLKKRLGRFTIGLTYDTPHTTVQAVAADIHTMLLAHEEVLNDGVEVRLSEFADNSLNIFVQFYADTVSIVEYRRILEDVNYRIMEIVEKNGASFAFPSRSVYFETPLKIVNDCKP